MHLFVLYSLTIAEKLGSGLGGNVYKGTVNKKWLRKTEVAIKSVNFWPNTVQMLKNEFKMFVHIGQHDNILKLIGCCTVMGNV